MAVRTRSRQLLIFKNTPAEAEVFFVLGTLSGAQSLGVVGEAQVDERRLQR
jgi:hypothetical protein